jgi:hypothetical protein
LIKDKTLKMVSKMITDIVTLIKNNLLKLRKYLFYVNIDSMKVTHEKNPLIIIDTSSVGSTLVSLLGGYSLMIMCHGFLFIIIELL